VLLEGYDSSVQTLFEALEGFSQSGPQSMGKSGADSSPDRAAVLPVEQKAMSLRESMNKDMGSLLKELRDFIVDMKDENVQPYIEMLNFLGNSEFLQTLLVYNENVLRNNLVRRYPENTAITMVTNQHLFCQTSEYQIDLRPVSIPESRLEIVLTKLGSMSETTLDTKTDAQIRQSGLSVEKFKKLSSTLVKLQRTMQVFPEIK
jgi:hypothetical protein